MEVIQAYIQNGLPSNLEFRESRMVDSMMGVWTKQSIKKGKTFGPFKGEKKKLNEVEDDTYSWEIRGPKGRRLYCVDAADPKKGNWMRYVKSARYFEEQNVIASQENRNIYYKAMRDIPSGKELLCWFSTNSGAPNPSPVINSSNATSSSTNDDEQSDSSCEPNETSTDEPPGNSTGDEETLDSSTDIADVHVDPRRTTVTKDIGCTASSETTGVTDSNTDKSTYLKADELFASRDGPLAVALGGIIISNVVSLSAANSNPTGNRASENDSETNEYMPILEKIHGELVRDVSLASRASGETGSASSSDLESCRSPPLISPILNDNLQGGCGDLETFHATVTGDRLAESFQKPDSSGTDTSGTESSLRSRPTSSCLLRDPYRMTKKIDFCSTTKDKKNVRKCMTCLSLFDTVTALREHFDNNTGAPERKRKLKRGRRQSSSYSRQHNQQHNCNDLPPATGIMSRDSINDNPINDEPVDDDPVYDNLIDDDPVYDNLINDDPVNDDSANDRLVIDDMIIGDLVIDDLVIDDPANDDPVNDALDIADPKNNNSQNDDRYNSSLVGSVGNPMDRQSELSKQQEIQLTSTHEFTCELCDLSFPSRSLLDIHAGSHVDVSDPSPSKDCKASSSDKSTEEVTDVSELPEQAEEKPGDIVDKSPDRPPLSGFHGSRKFNKIHPCDLCTKMFSSRNNVNRHRRKVHHVQTRRRRKLSSVAFAKNVLSTQLDQPSHTSEDELSTNRNIYDDYLLKNGTKRNGSDNNRCSSRADFQIPARANTSVAPRSKTKGEIVISKTFAGNSPRQQLRTTRLPSRIDSTYSTKRPHGLKVSRSPYQEGSPVSLPFAARERPHPYVPRKFPSVRLPMYDKHGAMNLATRKRNFDEMCKSDSVLDLSMNRRSGGNSATTIASMYQTPEQTAPLDLSKSSQRPLNNNNNKSDISALMSPKLRQTLQFVNAHAALQAKDRKLSGTRSQAFSADSYELKPEVKVGKNSGVCSRSSSVRYSNQDSFNMFNKDERPIDDCGNENFIPSYEAKKTFTATDEHLPRDSFKEDGHNVHPMDTKTTEFACNVCGVVFQSMKEMNVHVFQHAVEWPYKCEFCVFLFKTPEGLCNHRSGLHHAKQMFACNVCGGDFVYLCNLQTHQLDIHGMKECLYRVLDPGELRPQNFTDPRKAASMLGQNDDQTSKSRTSFIAQEMSKISLLKINKLTSKRLSPGLTPQKCKTSTRKQVPLNPQRHHPFAHARQIGYLNMLANPKNQKQLAPPLANRCTKCKQEFEQMVDFHKHIMECASSGISSSTVSNMSNKKTTVGAQSDDKVRPVASSSLKGPGHAARKQHPNLSPDSEHSGKRPRAKPGLKIYNPMKYSRREPAANMDDIHACPGCGRKFFFINRLERHMRMCPNKDKMILSDMVEVGKLSNKGDQSSLNCKHQCPLCKHQYTYLKSLQKHMKVCTIGENEGGNNPEKSDPRKSENEGASLIESGNIRAEENQREFMERIAKPSTETEKKMKKSIGHGDNKRMLGNQKEANDSTHSFSASDSSPSVSSFHPARRAATGKYERFKKKRVSSTLSSNNILPRVKANGISGQGCSEDENAAKLHLKKYPMRERSPSDRSGLDETLPPSRGSNRGKRRGGGRGMGRPSVTTGQVRQGLGRGRGRGRSRSGSKQRGTQRCTNNDQPYSYMLATSGETSPDLAKASQTKSRGGVLGRGRGGSRARGRGCSRGRGGVRSGRRGGVRGRGRVNVLATGQRGERRGGVGPAMRSKDRGLFRGRGPRRGRGLRGGTQTANASTVPEYDANESITTYEYQQDVVAVNTDCTNGPKFTDDDSSMKRGLQGSGFEGRAGSQGESPVAIAPDPGEEPVVGRTGGKRVHEATEVDDATTTTENVPAQIGYGDPPTATVVQPTGPNATVPVGDSGNTVPCN